MFGILYQEEHHQRRIHLLSVPHVKERDRILHSLKERQEAVLESNLIWFLNQQRSDRATHVDAFLAAGLCPLARGDLVRFIRRRPSVFSFDKQRYMIHLV